MFFAELNKSFTASIDFSKFDFSSAESSISTIFSTPPEPIITGTPA